MTTLALIIGLVVVNVVAPGVGMNVDAATIDATSVAQYVSAGTAADHDRAPARHHSDEPGGRLREGRRPPGAAGVAVVRIRAAGLGAAGTPLFELLEKLTSVLFRIVGMIMRAAPIGAFGAMAFTIASFGVGALAQLGTLIACFYADLPVVHLRGARRDRPVARLRIWRFIKYIRDEIFIVFGTSSSESVLPRIMEKLEGLGVQRSVVGVVVPAGYSFNLDGTAIYLAIASVFIAQATNTPLGLQRQLALLAPAADHVERVGRGGGRRAHRAGGHAVGDRFHSGCRRGPDPRHPPVHGRSDGGDQSHRQRRRDDRRRQVVRPDNRTRLTERLARGHADTPGGVDTVAAVRDRARRLESRESRFGPALRPTAPS